MKVDPKKAAMIGLAATTVFATAGCGMLPGSNEPTTVYGPPEWFGDVDPSENYNEDVYGPPEWFGEVEEDETVGDLEETIIGSWQGEVGPFYYTYYFGSDGSVRWEADGGEGGTGSYEVSGDTVTLYLEDNVKVFTYALKADTDIVGILLDEDDNEFTKIDSVDPIESD